MAEILVKAIDASNLDSEKDLKCYKRGNPVVVMNDGHSWGLEERRPKFVVIKVPLISKSSLLKYTKEHIDPTDPDKHILLRRRIWTIRWVDLPVAARNKLQNNGTLTIKATASYTGTFDYTWTQIKTYFRNQVTGVDETTEPL